MNESINYESIDHGICVTGLLISVLILDHGGMWSSLFWGVWSLGGMALIRIRIAYREARAEMQAEQEKEGYQCKTDQEQ